MRGLLVLAAALALGGAAMPRMSAAQNVTTQIDISRMNPGFAPEGFTFWRTGDGDVGDWRVVEDPSASDRQVIAQTSMDPTDYRFPIAVYRPISYVVRANALEDNVRFYRMVKGQREQLDGTDIKVASNDWHTLGLRAADDRFTISFDGKQLFTAQDNTFAGPGKVALWTKADSVTHFDSITITPLE